MSKTVEIIKQLRGAGFSQTEIARRSGVPQSRISRWEAGHVAAAADDALRLLDLVNSVSLDESHAHSPGSGAKSDASAVDASRATPLTSAEAARSQPHAAPAPSADTTDDSGQPVLVLDGAASPQSDVKEGV